MLVSTGDYYPTPHPSDRFLPDASPAKPEISLPSVAVSSSGDGSRRLTPLTLADSGTEMNISNHSRVKLEEHMELLNRPEYVLTKIEAFFSDSRPTSRTSTNGPLADLNTAYPGPIPDLPHIASSGDRQLPCNEHLTEDQEIYFLRWFWEAYHPLLHTVPWIQPPAQKGPMHRPTVESLKH